MAKECVYAITNSCSNADISIIDTLNNYNFMELIVENLKNNDANIIKACLEALENLLNIVKQTFEFPSPNENPYVLRLAQAGGFPVIEVLQHHPENSVYSIVSRIIDNHLETDNSA